MGVQTHARGRQSLARRAGWMLGVSALALTIALGGCRAGARNNNSDVPVSQSTSGSSSATGATSSGTGDNAALQRLEGADTQNQTDQQQLNSAQNSASVDYSSQDSPLQP